MKRLEMLVADLAQKAKGCARKTIEFDSAATLTECAQAWPMLQMATRTSSDIVILHIAL